ncbi:SRPBCC family protein [Mycolicibacterium thermoresistibile]
MTKDLSALQERFSHSESIYIDAPPQQVWDVVTDIERTGEWSPICRACWWKEPATGPEVGAWFHGRNESGDQVWETESLVVAAEEPVEFTWMVLGNAVRWSYVLAPEGDGTTLTESWALQPAGIEGFRQMFGDDADAELEVRREAALSGIPATLQAIKKIVEDAR